VQPGTHVQPAQHVAIQDLSSNPPDSQNGERLDTKQPCSWVSCLKHHTAKLRTLLRDAIQEQDNLQISCDFVVLIGRERTYEEVSRVSIHEARNGLRIMTGTYHAGRVLTPPKYVTSISVLFCDITQRRVVILYRRFGTTYQSHLQGSQTSWSSKMGLIPCPETSEKDYHTALRNTPEERRSHRRRGGSLKSRVSSSSSSSSSGGGGGGGGK
jgi:uncharacterized membrane protein YgcG